MWYRRGQGCGDQCTRLPGQEDRRDTQDAFLVCSVVSFSPIPLRFLIISCRRVIYIERNDFRLVDSKDYKGLAPEKEVGLKYAFNIKCTKVIMVPLSPLLHCSLCVLQLC